MTANIAGQERFGWKDRAAVAREVFQKTYADIVGFQEFGIDCWKTLGSARPELELVPGILAGDIVINSCAYNPEKFHLIDRDTCWLSPTGRCEKAWNGSERGFSWLKLREKKEHTTLLFFNMHLDNKSALARRESMKLIFRHMKRLQPIGEQQYPIILVGDSNVSVDSPQKRWQETLMRAPYDMALRAGFVDAWRFAHGSRPYTFHGFKGDIYTTDQYGTWDTEWIFLRGFSVHSCSLITESIDGIYPSDHYWMTARIKTA